MQVYMTAKCKEILNLLLNSDVYLSQQQIADRLHVTKRSIYYDICRINEWLDFYGIPELEVIRGKGIFISSDSRKKIEECTKKIQEDEGYIFSPMERVHIIICVIIYSLEPVYIEKLIEYCQVSRNTIFNDLKIVSGSLTDYGLTLEYEPKRGYKILGDSIKSRAVFLSSFHKIRSLFSYGGLKFIDQKKVDRYIEILKKMEDELNTRYVDGILDSLAVLLPIIERGNSEIFFQNLKKAEIESTKEFQLIKKYFPKFEELEKIYLCIHLLGARVAVVSNDIFETNSNQMVYELTKALIAEFERTACVIFEDKEELERSLFTHINSSLYRYQYGIQIINSISDDIIREYRDLFEITKIVSRYIEQQIGLPIQDSEVAYLAMHFGAHLYVAPQKSVAPHVLIVCANGIATSSMLKRELQKMLGPAAVVDVIPATDFAEDTKIYDFVVSTIKIKTSMPVVYVHPVLTETDRESIMRYMKNSPVTDIEQIFKLVKPYVEEKNYSKVRESLRSYFLYNKKSPAKNTDMPGLPDILKETHIGIHEGEFRWTQAIYLSAESLVGERIIERSYADDIISQLRYYGPYMFLVPRVILAHSKPENGVHRLGVSLHFFKDSVKFSDFYKANVVIILAAENQESHLKILKDILNIFTIETRIDRLIQMEKPLEVIYYIRKILESNENNEY